MQQGYFFILVLYNCRLSDSESFNSITKSLKESKESAFLYVYDNSATSQLLDDNKKDTWIDIKYTHDPTNPGLSYAYNKGAVCASSLGYKWIVLLDQDTEFNDNYIPLLNNAIATNLNINMFAPILQLNNGAPFSPSIYKYKRGYSIVLHSGIHSLKKYAPVNSGLAIKLISFNEVGGYVNKVKLDFADFQFIERFRNKYKLFYLINSIAIQDFSNDDVDINRVISRFNIYLDCAINCQRKSCIDRILYFYTVFRHTLGLTLKFRNLIFVKLFYLNYIKLSK